MRRYPVIRRLRLFARLVAPAGSEQIAIATSHAPADRVVMKLNVL